jgi:hypothetical protein
MQKKWIVYKIVCFILFSLSTGMCFLIVRKNINSQTFNNISYIEAFDFIGFLVFAFFSIFYLFCLNLIFKKYPSNEISNKYENIFQFFFITTSIAFVILIMAFIYGIVEVLGQSKSIKNGNSGNIVFGISTIFIMGHFYCLKKCFEIKAIITQNLKQSQQIDIDSIGAN